MKNRSLPNPQRIRDYLETHGWRECHPMPPVGALFEFEKLSDDHQQITVFVPAHTEFDDYSLRISEIVVTVSAVERRSKEAVWADLLAENTTVSSNATPTAASPESPAQPLA